MRRRASINYRKGVVAALLPLPVKSLLIELAEFWHLIGGRKITVTKHKKLGARRECFCKCEEVKILFHKSKPAKIIDLRCYIRRWLPQYYAYLLKGRELSLLFNPIDYNRFIHRRFNACEQ